MDLARRGQVIVLVIAGMLSLTAEIRAEPPFSGTIFIDPDIIMSSDPTTFDGATYAGQGERLMFDRRTNSFNTYTAFLFDATFTDGFVVEIQVNPEFGSEAAALAEAEKYGPVIGQLPKALRVDVETVWIHKGVEPFGGGNNNLLIHTGQADLYIADGILEETLVHEAAHTSLDASHAATAGWLSAQQADPEFISTYARDNPTREDIAESFLPYLAVRHRLDRISESLANSITGAIPNRLAYFDNQAFELAPLAESLVISQIYGGGGNSGATLTNDFVELFNAGASTVSLDGWTIQYAAPSGTTWDSMDLAGSISSGQYYLLQGGQGSSGGGGSLPIPDAIGGVSFGATNGKLALVNSSVLLAISCPVGSAGVVDFVGYGSANCSEGNAASALTNTTALLRNDGGCTDADNNASDFTQTSPAPRNSSQSRSACVTGSDPTNPAITGLAAPSSVHAGSNLLFTASVTPGANPISTGISVTADLSALGGSPNQAFFDNGTNGDLASGDSTFSFQIMVSATASAGIASVVVTVTDSETRAASTSISLTVTLPVGTESFSITDRGGNAITSSGTAEAINVGYGRIRPDSGATTPSGIAIFGFRQGGVLLSEAGVPAAEPIQEGRIFAEVNGPVNTGLAIANPNDVTATISFYFTDVNGTDFGSSSFELGANQQTAKFLDQDPFNGGSSVLGTFTFTSSVPISVIALRGFTNKDSEFLMTTLPVAPLSSASTVTVYFPHFADGLGWVTRVILVNPTDSTITGTVEFLGPGSGTTAASPATLTLADGSVGSSFDYSIPPRSSKKFTTSNPSSGLSVGSVRATPDSGNTAPSGLVVFSFASGEKTLSEAGVPALPKGSAFRVYVETSGTPEQIGSIRSGLAITNTASTSNTVTLEVTNLDGSLTVAPVTITIPPSGQVATFLDQVFSLPGNFFGVLRVTATADIAIVGLRLRVNENNEIKMTTTPPSNEASASITADTFFPHIVDSDGWSTQFVVFSGTAGQSSSGTLSFIDASGQPLDLTTTASATSFQVHFLDVGTGDAAIIDIGEVEIVIDGGNSNHILHDYAERTDIIDGPIELVVVTHGDSDHWKGLTRLLGFDGQATSPRTAVEFWEPGYNRDCNPLASYDEFISDVQALPGITFKRPLEIHHVPADVNPQVSPVPLSVVPGVSVTVLHSSSTPDASNGDCSYRINNASIVLMIEIGRFRFLFTGDANGKERNEPSPGTPGHVEARLLSLSSGTLQADVLYVPHHGSETASTQAFIDAVNPRIVVISSSTQHDLPRDSVVDRYDNGARTILRTDRDISSDNDHIVCSGSAVTLTCEYSD